MSFNDQHLDVVQPLKAAPLRPTMRIFVTAIRTLADRWMVEGCNAFDEGNTPVETAEAAGKLRCALELSQVLGAFGDHRLEHGTSVLRAVAAEHPEFNSGALFASDRRSGPGERRRATRTDRRGRA